jgi:hypothetical protein
LSTPDLCFALSADRRRPTYDRHACAGFAEPTWKRRIPMADKYQPFNGHEWLDNPIDLTGGALRLANVHPSVPRALTRDGRKARVYKAQRNEASVAVKVFHRPYALPINIVTTAELVPYQPLDGLRVCDRQVIDLPEARRLGIPGLAYAILMPWIDGDSWATIVQQRRQLDQASCLALARRTATILAGLEARRLVHADVSGTNVFIANSGPQPTVELIDVEDMYHPSFVDVPNVPDGTPGYIHPANQGLGCRTPGGDRFASAVLLAEMLVWHQSAIRASRNGDSYFDSRELCRPGPKYRLVRELLAAHSPTVAALFAQAWNSQELVACPTLAQWRDALAAAHPADTTARPSMSLPRAAMRSQ